MNCHKCTKKDCLNCTKSNETYSFKYQKYILEGYEVEQPDTQCSEPATNLKPDIEDYLRKMLYTIFDLSPNELLCLKAIMNQQSLTDWCKDMEKLSQKNKEFSRFRAFQTRKGILKKLGTQFKGALMTLGQRKELKA